MLEQDTQSSPNLDTETPAKTLSIVLPIWVYDNKDEPRQWYRDLRNMLDSLMWQTVEPDEVIIVNMGPSAKHVNNISQVVDCYPVTQIKAPRAKFNMSWGFNVGISRAESDYIAAVGYEMIFGMEAVEAMVEYMEPHRILAGCCGFLGKNVDLSDPLNNWDKIMSTMKYSATVGRDSVWHQSVGTIQVMHRDKWHGMRGYNELFAFSHADSELIHRAVKSGLRRVAIPCDRAMWLHPWHVPSELVGKNPMPNKLDDSPIRANPDGWGEYDAD